MKIINRPSPNFDDRQRDIDMLVLHYTGMKSAEEAIERLCNPESKVSAHYVVDVDGSVFGLVDEEKRAWHAGVSFWRGVENVNHNSIGIEIVNPGHEFGYRPFTQAQYRTLIPLCQKIKARWGIEDVNIVGHSDIAPDRKQDPGELFDWQLLAKNGIGLWAKIKTQILDDSNLIDLGYRSHDEASITAFQRHWRPNMINGQWDEGCAYLLQALLTKIN